MAIKQHPVFTNFNQVEHPLLIHKLSLLRKIDTPKKEFRELVSEITSLLAYEVTKDLPLTTKTIQTPFETIEAQVLVDKSPILLAVLRAGLGMVDGFLNILPTAKVAHIGLYRDEKTFKPHFYYFKAPEHSENCQYFVCDIMLATGGSAVATIDYLKKNNINKITLLSILAAPEGVEKLFKTHPDVPIFAVHLDRTLNENAYILPGIGDAGDRLFGTK